MIVSSSKQGKYSEEKLNEFREIVENLIKSSDSLVNIFNKSSEYIEEKFDKTATSKQKPTNKETKSKKSTANNQEDNTATKKCSMKTAADVVNRIQWDEEIDKAFVSVGYIDRFLGLKECAFNTFDWGDIVLADLGSLAIPEHRISYFKYKNELVWDKNTRLDNVFGSTGSNTTIHDVIKKLENKTFVANEEKDEEEVNRIGRNSRNGGKKEPNYFLSIPVNNPDLKAKFTALRDELLKVNPGLEKYIIPETSLHLTLCTLRIDEPEETEKTKRVLQRLFSDAQFRTENFPISIEFKGIGEFFNKVFYIDCQSSDIEKLERVKRLVLDEMRKEEISTAGNYYEFVPHLTVFKIKNEANNKSSTVKELISNDLWSKYEQLDFGKITVDEFELCKMVNIFSCLAYPVELTVKIEQ